MNFCWKTINHAQPVPHHSLKWIESHLIFIEEIIVVGVDVVGIEWDIRKIFQERIPSHQKWKYNETEQHGNWRGLQNKPPKTHEEKCHRCGMKGH